MTFVSNVTDRMNDSNYSINVFVDRESDRHRS